MTVTYAKIMHPIRPEIEDRPVAAHTTIEIVGFKPFTTDRDSTIHQILAEFVKREYPDETISSHIYLCCFSYIENGCTKTKIQLAHTLYA